MGQKRETEKERPFVTAGTLLPEMVARFPSTRTVLDRYGLKGWGDALVPYETVTWFARVHNIPLPELLRELNEAASQSVSREVRVSPAPSLVDIIYFPFFAMGAFFAVAFGALWGAVSLMLMGVTGGMQFAVPYGWLLAHGQAMLFGFVVSVMMGVAYQVFPRFKQTPLPFPRLAFSALPLLVVGLTLHIVALFFVPPSVTQGTRGACPQWALALGVVGTGLQWISVTLFWFIIAKVLRYGRRQGFEPFFHAALFWLWLSAGATLLMFLYWGTVTDLPTFVRRIAPWNAPLRDAQMFGFATQLIFGISLLPALYGFRRPPLRSVSLSFFGLNFATLLSVISFPLFVLTRHPFAASVYWFALAMLLALTFGHLWHFRLFAPPLEPDRSGKFLRAGFIWAIGGLGMGLVLPFYHTLTGQSFSHNYFAAYRHAILSGFVLLTVVGVSSRVAPTLAGGDVRKANPLWMAFLLLNLGNLGRVIGQTLMDLTTWSGLLAAVSGFVQWAGLAIWAEDLWHHLWVAWKAMRELKERHK